MESILNPNVFNLSLDPETAHPNLILSEDMTSVRYSILGQRLPYNPKRFDPRLFVLGSQGFTSGRHYWEVVVGDKIVWFLGVVKESINRKGNFIMNPENGYWGVCRSGNAYTASESSEKLLSLSVKPQRIGTYLDYEGGQMSFYNADGMSHIYTFSDAFNGILYPCFCPGSNTEPLNMFHLKL
ncbi:zinc-binding protein A33-like [Protopterus annectens]|uniref:zinc-binding protein A33-like n=1 Tax=Protopterus annectens TaxID=7888 RepID=UPI001CFBD5A5|nr:zinc-binding protein A33-like [Protopterus annectens]